MKFNNLGLALGMTLKFYKNVGKGLKLKVRKFLVLMPKLTEVTEEILVGWPFCPPILNRVNFYSCFQSIFCTDSDKSVAE